MKFFRKHKRLVLSVLAIVFGFVTVKSGGFALFGGDAGKQFAGDYVSFVLWFNFLAGFFYMIAGVGVYLGAKWSVTLARFLMVSTLLVFTAFLLYITTGVNYEMRTVGAMTVRALFWVGMFFSLRESNKK